GEETTQDCFIGTCHDTGDSRFLSGFLVDGLEPSDTDKSIPPKTYLCEMTDGQDVYSLTSSNTFWACSDLSRVLRTSAKALTSFRRVLRVLTTSSCSIGLSLSSSGSPCSSMCSSAAIICSHMTGSM